MATDPAVDPDVDPPTLTWSVSGADGSKFNIGNETDGTPGELKFKEKPDYEKPTDANDGQRVRGDGAGQSDGKKTGMRKVMVSVKNVQEGGVVTLDPGARRWSASR